MEVFQSGLPLFLSLFLCKFASKIVFYAFWILHIVFLIYFAYIPIPYRLNTEMYKQQYTYLFNNHISRKLGFLKFTRLLSCCLYFIVQDDTRNVYIINDTTIIIIIYNIECTCDRSDVFCLVNIKIYISIRYTFGVWFFSPSVFLFVTGKIKFFLPFSLISIFSPRLSLHSILYIYMYTISPYLLHQLHIT